MKKLSQILDNHAPAGRQRKQYHKSDDLFDFLSLIDSWKDIVGERLASRTTPLKNNRKTLTILTDHSAFSQQLSFMEKILIEKVIEKFPNLKGQIDRIRFQTNSEHFQLLKKRGQFNKESRIPNTSSNNIEIHPHSPLYKKLKAEADELFKDIDNPETKESLISIFIQRGHQK